MEWVKAIIWFLKGNNAKEFKEVISEWKDLKEEYKRQVVDQKKRITELEKNVHELELHEANCQQQLIVLTKQYRDVKEELIFIKIQKKKDE